MSFVIRKRELVNFATPQEMYDDYKNRRINGIQDYQSKIHYLKQSLSKVRGTPF